ncbi:hypothetical protein ACVJGD_007797 [Bradyrhizobium sp. USDA 10063]
MTVRIDVSSSETLTYEGGVKVNLEPGQAAVAQLIAHKGTAKVLVEYVSFERAHCRGS